MDHRQCALACVTAITAVVLAAATAGCGRASDAPKLNELQRTRSGAIDVVLLAAGDALKAGKDQAFLEFRSTSDGRPVDVGTVKVSATMPMAGMAPMLGSTIVAKTDATGRYAIDTDLGMVGTWRIGVEWDGPLGRGSATLPGRVQ